MLNPFFDKVSRSAAIYSSETGPKMKLPSSLTSVSIVFQSNKCALICSLLSYPSEKLSEMWILHYNSSSTAPLFIEVLTRLAILSSSGSFKYFISGFSFDISSVGIIEGSIVLGTSKDSYFLIIFETKS